MKSRSATAAEARKAAAATGESERPNHKRPYNRKSLLCRLCLRVLPKEQLPEIFAQSCNLPKIIRTAVGTEVTKKDRSVRICFCCLELVQLINDFRGTCERAEVLFTQNVEIANEAFWMAESDQKVFGKCRALVDQYKYEVEKLFTGQVEVICDIEVLDESKVIIEDHVSVDETTFLPEECVNVDEKGKAVKEELEDLVYLEEEHLEEHHSGSDRDFAGSDLDDPDFVADDECEQNTDQQIDEEFKPQPEVKPQIPDSGDRPRRRGRPSLPEELLKRKKRKPGEPKKKPGPKGSKLPPQSVCEVCGILVSRENQERHRNEHLGHRPYTCTIEGCSHAFSSKAGLHGHLARHADRDKVYECDICGAKIKTKSSLHRHKKLHTAEKPHGCDICGKRFWRKAYLNHHATVHTGVAKFPCEYCGFVFKNKYWRSFHIKQKHVAKGEAPKFEALEELPEHGEMAEVLEEGMEMGQIHA